MTNDNNKWYTQKVITELQRLTAVRQSAEEIGDTLGLLAMRPAVQHFDGRTINGWTLRETTIFIRVEHPEIYGLMASRPGYAGEIALIPVPAKFYDNMPVRWITSTDALKSYIRSGLSDNSDNISLGRLDEADSGDFPGYCHLLRLLATISDIPLFYPLYELLSDMNREISTMIKTTEIETAVKGMVESSSKLTTLLTKAICSEKTDVSAYYSLIFRNLPATLSTSGFICQLGKLSVNNNTFNIMVLTDTASGKDLRVYLQIYPVEQRIRVVTYCILKDFAEMFGFDEHKLEDLLRAEIRLRSDIIGSEAQVGLTSCLVKNNGEPECQYLFSPGLFQDTIYRKYSGQLNSELLKKYNILCEIFKDIHNIIN